jgi:hypothetical protein
MKTILIPKSQKVQVALVCLSLGLTMRAGAVIPSSSRSSAVSAFALLASADTQEQPPRLKRSSVNAPEADTDTPKAKAEAISIESADSESDKWEHKEVAWLGVATEEASDAVASQLGLRPGEGLLVIYVATNSPAATAGLKKNDLLFEFDSQRLVLPAQLRKLVQMRSEGDSVDLTIYRSGQKQNISATLGKTKTTVGMKMDMTGHEAELAALQNQLRDMPSAEGVREQVRKAVAESIRQATNAYHSYGANARTLAELSRNSVDVDKDATITIKSRDNSTRTVVKTDESGTYVIVANPQKRLLAHDKAGKLLFDGEIETSDQQSKVPSEVWKRVKPMVEQLKPSKQDGNPVVPKKTSTRPRDSFLYRSSQRIADLRTLIAMLRFVLEPDPVPTAMARTNSPPSRIAAT